MGVYSELAREVVRENAFDDNFPSVKASNDIEFGSIVESTSLDIFSSLLKCDLAQAYNESGDITLSDEDYYAVNEGVIKDALDKIMELIDKAIKWVKEKVTKVVQDIQDFFDRDQALRKKYGVLKMEKLQNCKLTGNVIKANWAKAGDASALAKAVLGVDPYDIASKAFDALKSATDGDAADTAKENVKEKMEEVSTKIGDVNLSDTLFDSDKPIATAENVSFINEQIKNKFRSAERLIRKEGDKAINGYKDIKRKTMFGAKENSESTNAIIKAKHEAVISIIKTLNKYVGFSIKVSSTIIKEVRKQYVELANYSKENKDSKKGNEAPGGEATPASTSSSSSSSTSGSSDDELSYDDIAGGGKTSMSKEEKESNASKERDKSIKNAQKQQMEDLKDNDDFYGAEVSKKVGDWNDYVQNLTGDDLINATAADVSALRALQNKTRATIRQIQAGNYNKEQKEKIKAANAWGRKHVKGWQHLKEFAYIDGYNNNVVRSIQLEADILGELSDIYVSEVFAL